MYTTKLYWQYLYNRYMISHIHRYSMNHSIHISEVSQKEFLRTTQHYLNLSKEVYDIFNITPIIEYKQWLPKTYNGSLIYKLLRARVNIIASLIQSRSPDTQIEKIIVDPDGKDDISIYWKWTEKPLYVKIVDISNNTSKGSFTGMSQHEKALQLSRENDEKEIASSIHHRFKKNGEMSIQIGLNSNNLSNNTLLALDEILYPEQTKTSKKIALDTKNISLRIIYHLDSLGELRPIISRLIANIHQFG